MSSSKDLHFSVYCVILRLSSETLVKGYIPVMTIKIDGEIYLTTVETIEKMRITRVTLDRLVDDGRLKRYKQGIRRTHYYKEVDVNALLEMREDSSSDSDE